MNKYINIFILLISISLLTGCKKTTENNNKSEINLDINKIEVIRNITEDNELLLTIKNPYEENINIEVTITYYDSEQNEIDFDYDFVECISSEETVYLGFDITEDNYNDYKIEVVPEINYSMHNRKENIEIKTVKKEKNIEVELLNKGEETIDVFSVIVLYYKNEKIIGYDIGTGVNLENNKIKTVKLYPPYQGKKVLEYDKYEVKINEAYTE